MVYAINPGVVGTCPYCEHDASFHSYGSGIIGEESPSIWCNAADCRCDRPVDDFPGWTPDFTGRMRCHSVSVSEGRCVLTAGHSGPHEGGRGQDGLWGTTPMGGSDGILSVQVWPSYVGACYGHPLLSVYSEPNSVDYQRGQIFWGPAGDDLPGLRGQTVGRGKIAVPAGEYTHLAYFYGPEGPCQAGQGFQLPHPQRFPTAGIFEVYPIVNPHAAMAAQV